MKDTEKSRMLQRSRRLAIATLAIVALAVGPSRALATPIAFSSGGAFNIGNFSVAVSGSLAAGCIDYYNVTTGCGTNATVTLNAPSDPIFGTVGTTTGSIKDLGSSPTFPQSTALTLNGFTFDLMSLVFPTPTPCPPAATPGSCAIAGSPFVFTQDTMTPGNATNSVDVSLTALYCGYTGSPGINCSTGTPYAATFTSHFVGTIDNTGLAATVSNLLAIVASPGGTITDSISGNFTPLPVPEPAASGLIGASLVALGLWRFRRVRS